MDAKPDDVATLKERFAIGAVVLLIAVGLGSLCWLAARVVTGDEMAADVRAWCLDALGNAPTFERVCSGRANNSEGQG